METENWTIDRQSVDQKRDFLVVKHVLRDGRKRQVSEYLLPLKSISMAVFESTVIFKTFPFNIPHSHKIIESGKVTYDRPLGEWQAHAAQKGLLEDSTVQQKTCSGCRTEFHDTSEQTLCYFCTKKSGQDTVRQAEKLCKLAEKYAKQTEWKQTADRIKDLQQLWKQLKHFPRDRNEALWSRFQSATQTFFDRRSAHFDEQDRQRQDNQAKAMRLIKKARSCAANSDLRQAREDIKRLQQEWKQVHPLPREMADELWNEFRSTCQTVFDN